MCGFFQVIQRHQAIDRERFRAALDSMRHRGPDQDGEHFVDVPATERQAGIYLAFGHRRLSILDLSERARQPYRPLAEVLLYNGELYNFHELADDLRTQGLDVEAHGDTEVLYHSLLRQGGEAVRSFNGMWALSLYRPAQNDLLLSRDRYGKKPLFYYQDENVICISSTIRAIRIYLDRSLSFRAECLPSYLAYGELFPSGDELTHFDHIRQVLPGHNAKVDLAGWSIEQQPYFDFYGSDDEPVEEGEQPLADLICDAIRKRLVSDRPVGLLLSGGVDSSLILSALSHMGLQDQCRIFMGDTGKSEDYEYARKSVERLGVKAETVVLDYDQNSFERFLEVCRHMEKPVSLNGSSMAMPAMYRAVSALGVPVVLDGTGGDELFGGYWPRQFPYALREAIHSGQWRWIVGQARCQYGEHQVLSHLPTALMPSVVSGWRKLKTNLKAAANPFLRIPLADALQLKPTDPLANTHLSFQQALCADMAPGGRLGEWIWHNDRNSMMSSVEGRSPILDYRLHRYVSSGYQNKFQHCWNKHELRKTFDLLKPLDTQWRKQKQGFRWDGKRFLLSNENAILELMRENQALAGLVNISRLCAQAHKNKRLLRTTLAKQVLTVAAVEVGMQG